MNNGESEGFLQNIKQIDEDFFEKVQERVLVIQPDIEADPELSLIKKIIGEVGAQIEYIKEKMVEIEKYIDDLKVIVKESKHALEAEKSRIRQEALTVYQTEQKEFIVQVKKIIGEVSKGERKLPSSVIQEMIKVIRPEKPTQNTLDDIAILRTERLQKEVFALEKGINEYVQYHGRLKALAEKYENKKFAAYKHGALKEYELKNLGS